MEFTPRLKQILTAMLEENHVMPVKALAEKIGVSKRTVQREMEYIGNSIAPYEVEFRSKTGIGVWLEGEEEKKKRLYEHLTKENVPDVTNRMERRKRLILEILKDKGLKKLYYYSELFGVSEATVSSDLESVQEWLEKFHLTIVRRPGYGIMIEGEEKSFRRALRSFIDENINTDLIKEAYENKNQSLLHMLGSRMEKNIYHILDDGILKRVIACIIGLNDERILNLTENSYVGLVLHVTIAIDRIQKEEIIESNKKLIDSLKEEEDYRLAKAITDALEKEFTIVIPEVETAYVCLHIKGAKKQQISYSNDEEDQNQSFLMEMVDAMIDAYDSSIAYLMKQDEDFIQGLIAHLKPTLVRLTNDMKIANPLLEQIKTDYEPIYKKCIYVAKVIEERIPFSVPESEIGFLAGHFGAAELKIENLRESKRKAYVGIICASGIGISRLMATKISKYFKDRVEITTYAKEDLTPYIIEKTDFFVSSISVPKETADIVFVSPLLMEQDMQEIEKRVYHYERTEKPKLPESEFTRQLDEVNYLAVQIKSMMKDMGYLKVDNAITFDELLVAISENLSPYQDRRLMIQEDIKKRERLDSQIFSDFGFALLHTRTKGVVKPTFLVSLTKDLGAYTDPYFKEISIVIVMLLPSDEHIKENTQMLGYLSEELIEDDSFLLTLGGGNKEKIQDVLSIKLKKFFNQYLDKM